MIASEWKELMLARRVHAENRNLCPVKGAPAEADLRVFSLHAPEVECIGPFGRLRRQGAQAL
jgi:hypothetical protein